MLNDVTWLFTKSRLKSNRAPLQRLFTLASLLSLGSLSACGEFDAPPASETQQPRALEHFDSCAEMLQYTRVQSLAQLESDDFFYGEVEIENAARGSDDSAEGLPSAGGKNNADFSTTNVQEAGVDEPDVIKTNGDRIVAISGDTLHIIDSSGMTPELRGSIDLPGGIRDSVLFMRGDRVLVISKNEYYRDNETSDGEENYGAELATIPEAWQTEDVWINLTQLFEIDISNPNSPTLVRSETIGGDLVAARMVQGSVRVVVRSMPVGLDLKHWNEFYTDGDRPEQPENDTPDDDETAAHGDGDSDDDGGSDDDGDSDGDGFFRIGSTELGSTVEGAKKLAREHNEAVLAGATAANWLPHHIRDDGNKVESSLIYGCEQAMKPGLESGIGVLSVLTFDLEKDLKVGAGVGIFSSGEQVYASTEGLYIATRPWSDWEMDASVAVNGGSDTSEIDPEDNGTGAEESSTEGEPNPGPDSDEFRKNDDYTGFTSYVHKFDISDPSRADYVASGEFRGWLLNQWSMSEHDDILRIASTDQDTVHGDTQESFVSTFAVETGDDEKAELIQQGQVRGLGMDERIYAVRFMGDTGYLVTFRETDPLYSLDLSDPKAPKSVGELKINGYSAYLHPLGKNHLIGIGQDATQDGQTTGTQVSIFDVSDLANPTRVQQLTLPESYSEAEYDHHAFLYWQPKNVAVLPVSGWVNNGDVGDDDPESDPSAYFNRSLVLRIDAGDEIRTLAEISHPAKPESGDDMPRQLRSLVIGEQLYTLSTAGLLSSDIDDFSEIAWIPLP